MSDLITCTKLLDRLISDPEVAKALTRKDFNTLVDAFGVLEELDELGT